MTPRSPYPAWPADGLYVHHTGMTDTRDLSFIHRGVPLSDAPTVALDLYLLPDPAPLPRPGRFRRLLLTLGIVGVVVGLLWAITVLNAISPLSSVR